MSDFREITEKELEVLGESYEILSSVLSIEGGPFTLYVAGEIKSGSPIFKLCEEAAAEYEVMEPEEIEKFKIEKLALVIQVTGDTIYYLASSGLMVGDDEEFAYQAKDSKEIKTANMKFGNGVRERLKFNQLIDPVLLENEDEIAEYLQSKTNGKIEAQEGVSKPVTEPAPAPETSVEIPEELAAEPAPETPTETELPEEGKESSLKKSDLEKSRIVRILDEYGNMWNDGDKESTMKLIQEVEMANDEHQFVSYAAGEISKWLIETKNGPEAAIRYIAMKSEIDYDTVAEEAAVLSKTELLDFLNEVLADAN